MTHTRGAQKILSMPTEETTSLNFSAVACPPPTIPNVARLCCLVIPGTIAARCGSVDPFLRARVTMTACNTKVSTAQGFDEIMRNSRCPLVATPKLERGRHPFYTWLCMYTWCTYCESIAQGRTCDADAVWAILTPNPRPESLHPDYRLDSHTCS